MGADSLDRLLAGLEARLQALRRRHATIDLVVSAVERDREVGGWLLASALTYQTFLVLLPLSLVAVGGLGMLSDATAESPEQAADALGLAGLVSSSVESAAESPARWYALAIGIPLVVWESRTLLRALISAHRLVWGDPRPTAPKPTAVATLRLLAAIIVLVAISAVTSTARATSFVAGLAVLLAGIVLYAVLWLLISDRLSHGQAPWRALLPGSILFAAGLGAIHLVTAYWLGGEASSKHGTYGALGLAAALLLGLFLISRLIIAAGILNATLWARRAPA